MVSVYYNFELIAVLLSVLSIVYYHYHYYHHHHHHHHHCYQHILFFILSISLLHTINVGVFQGNSVNM